MLYLLRFNLSTFALSPAASPRPRLMKQGFHLALGKIAPLPGFKVAQVQRPKAHTNQPPHGMTDGRQ